MKIGHLKNTISLFLLFFFTGIGVFGQFYNGLQMSFGKNRVQYWDFYWSYYRFEKFDTYFNEYGRELAEYTANYAEKRIIELEDYFDYYLDKRLIFLIYNKLSDFKQSNIGLISGNEEFNTGGVTKIIKNKVILYFEGDHKKFEQQISSAIAEVLIYEMLYSGDVKDRVANSTLINMPDWYFKGLISYLSNPWDYEVENRVKDGILTDKYKKFNRLTGEEAVYAGHSFWKYLAEKYGDPIIPNIIYLTRINKNVNNGFLYVLGSKIKDLSKDWLVYYQEKYQNTDVSRDLPDNPPILAKSKRTRVYNKVRISPDGQHLAYSSNESGQYKIWIYDSQTRKHKKIIKKEAKIDQINDFSYPILAWHPSGKLLAFITEEKGGLVQYLYRLSTRELERKNILYYDKILDFSYSHDGTQFVFSAVKEGLTDLFVHNIASSTNEQLTRDIADDFHPRFVRNSDAIIFSSNRLSDTLYFRGDLAEKTGLNFDLFIYDYKNKSPYLTRLREGIYLDKLDPSEVSNNNYLYLNDLNGILNRYVAQFDS
ncbi:MAG: PD40 domain-containing protein, partial [Bacteroidales bacterium]